jgi:signal peptidase II
MKVVQKIVLLVLIIIICLSCDQITKKIAREKLENRPVIFLFNDLFRFQYAENEGGFLSLGSDLPESVNFWTLRFIPLVFLMALLIYIIFQLTKISNTALISLALIFSGGAGNLINRFINDRVVVDFMNMGIWNLRTGIFNFADIFILSGAVLFFISYMFERKPRNDNKDAAG